MSRSEHSHLVPILQALLVTFLWSTSWVLIRFGLEEVAPLGFAGLRYALAAAVLLPALLARGELRVALARLGRRDLQRLVLLGVVFYTLTQGALFVALGFLPAVTLSLILSFSPAAVALLGLWLLEERLSRLQWIGVAVFIVGAGVYFLPFDLRLSAVGLAAGLVCLAANSWGSILGRAVNRARSLDPLVVTVVSMGTGALVLLGVGLAVEGVPDLSPKGWAIVAWLAVVNTAFAFTLWNHTLRRLTAIESSLINNTMLVQIAILAWLFLGEPIGAREGAGLVLALAGVLLVQLPGREAAASRPGPSPSGSDATE